MLLNLCQLRTSYRGPDHALTIPTARKNFNQVVRLQRVVDVPVQGPCRGLGEGGSTPGLGGLEAFATCRSVTTGTVVCYQMKGFECYLRLR